MRPLCEFRRTRGKPRGKCLDCERAYDRSRTQQHTQINKTWRERNRDKMRAHSAVQRALRAGTLIRPLACEGPKCPDRAARLEAHHDDYSKPLDVKWLCEICHKQRHVELRLEARPFQNQRWGINEAMGFNEGPEDIPEYLQDPPF